MKKSVLFLSLLAGSFVFGQTTCNEVPVTNPEVIAGSVNGQLHLTTHMPVSIGDDVSSYGVFQITVNCSGVVEGVVLQDSQLSPVQVADLIDVIEGITFTAATNGGSAVRSIVTMSLKITAGEPSFGLN